MKKIGIYSNKHKDKKFTLGKEIIKWFNRLDISPYVNFYVNSKEFDCTIVSDDYIFNDVDVIILLGGDGTLLSIARICAMEGIPILGINLGTVGYLTYIEKSDVFEALEKFMAKDYRLDERLMLETNRKDSMGKLIALNDFVITKGVNTTVISLDITINGTNLGVIRGDGLIVSTPTGSTAYNFSAGGPILEPSSSTYVVTPICSQDIFFRPFVISSKDEVSVKVNYRSRNDVALIMDGRLVKNLEQNEEITFSISSYKTKLIHIYDVNFFDVFKNKLSNASY
ncbi:MAG: NAD(+)/NADH kinase [Lachnospirales bacterium]